MQRMLKERRILKGEMTAFWVILVTLVACVSVVFWSFIPELKNERIKNVQEKVALVNSEYDDIIWTRYRKLEAVVLDYYPKIAKRSELETFCEDVFKCTPFVCAVSVEYRSDLYPENDCFFSEIGDSGNVVVRDSVQYKDYSLFSWDCMNNYFLEHPDEVLFKGATSFFPIIGRTVFSYHYPIGDDKDKSIDAFVSVYVDVNEVQRCFANNPYERGEYFAIDDDSLFVKAPHDSLLGKPAYSWLKEKFGEDVLDSLKRSDSQFEANVYSTKKWTFFRSYVTSAKRDCIYALPTKDFVSDLDILILKALLCCLVALFIISFTCYKVIKSSVDIKAKRQSLVKDMETAASIQMSMLSKPVNMQGLDLCTFLKPALAVGGDLYYCAENNGKLYFCIGDVSGKGITAALFMSKCVSSFCEQIQHARTARDIVTNMNRSLSENNDLCLFVTMFVGILDLQTNELNYCNAGHEEPIFWDGNDQHPSVYLQISANLPLGIDADSEFSEGTMSLNEGEVLLLYTDGVDEAMNKKSKQYGRERLLDFMQKNVKCSAKMLVDKLMDDIHIYVGETEQSDDITIVAMRRQSL